MARRHARSTFRLLRALWRYRGKIEAHGDQYQAELATAVHTTLDQRLVGRTALGAYRLAMRALLVGAVVLVLVAVLLAVVLWRVEHWAAAFSLLVLIPAGLLAWWRISWGAPLDWLDEHADPARTVSITELPASLRRLAAESRRVADIPARIGDELDELAREVEDAPVDAPGPSTP
ncbi:MAG: hypothetical protein JWM98_983 [Thermoleophilia bacterium]|nr:hypothetical protein [Thermoleophilia bacterium]